MDQTEFNKELARFSKKRRFESALFYGFIFFCGVLCFLQLNGLLLSTFGVTTILIINIISLVNISGRSSSLYKSMSTYYRLKVSSYAPINSPAIKMSADMERDLGQPLQKEIKLNTTLLYLVGVLATICSLIVCIDAFLGQFRIYKFDLWVNNTVYFGYFLLMMILYRIMFLSEKRFVKIQMKFVEYMEKIERMRVYKDS